MRFCLAVLMMLALLLPSFGQQSDAKPVRSFTEVKIEGLNVEPVAVEFSAPDSDGEKGSKSRFAGSIFVYLRTIS